MRFLIMVKHEAGDPARTAYEEGAPLDPEAVKKMMAFNEELMKSGALISGEGLRPSSHGAKIKFDQGKRSVIDGPFTEAKELVGGFWIARFRTKQEAVEFMKRCPLDEDGVIEIREIFDIGDHGGEVTETALEFARKRHEFEKSKPE